MFHVSFFLTNTNLLNKATPDLEDCLLYIPRHLERDEDGHVYIYVYMQILRCVYTHIYKHMCIYTLYIYIYIYTNNT